MTLKDEVIEFITTNSIPRTKFGKDALGDPRLVDDLCLGRKCSSRVENKIRRYMERYENAVD